MKKILHVREPASEPLVSHPHQDLRDDRDVSVVWSFVTRQIVVGSLCFGGRAPSVGVQHPPLRLVRFWAPPEFQAHQRVSAGLLRAAPCAACDRCVGWHARTDPDGLRVCL